MTSNSTFELYENDIIDMLITPPLQPPHPSLNSVCIPILPSLPTYPSKIPTMNNYNHPSSVREAPWHLMSTSFIIQDAAKPDVFDFIYLFLRTNHISFTYDNFQECFIITIDEFSLFSEKRNCLQKNKSIVTGSTKKTPESMDDWIGAGLTLNNHLYDNVGEFARRSAGTLVSGTIVEAHSLSRMSYQMLEVYRTLRESLSVGVIQIIPTDDTQSNPESTL